MSGLDLNDFDDSAVIAAISAKTQRLRKAFRDAEAEYREWVDGLEVITGVDFDPELKPSDGAGPPPPSEPAPSPTPPPPTPPPAPPSRNRPASMADKQRQVDDVVETARKIGGRVGKGQIWRALDLELSEHQVKSAISEAVRLGRLEKVGKGAGTRYVAVESKAPVTEGPPKDRDPKPTGTQQPTVQGRILATLQMGEATASGLAGSLGVPLDEITVALGHLLRDGDIRMIKGGKYRLAA